MTSSAWGTKPLENCNLGGTPGKLTDFALSFGALSVKQIGSELPTGRSEEHTSELQSQFHLVCRLLLEKKKTRCLEPRQPPRTRHGCPALPAVGYAHQHFIGRGKTPRRPHPPPADGTRCAPA